MSSYAANILSFSFDDEDGDFLGEVLDDELDSDELVEGSEEDLTEEGEGDLFESDEDFWEYDDRNDF